jgi:nucleotide-binding universal stress UspA family protein
VPLCDPTAKKRVGGIYVLAGATERVHVLLCLGPGEPAVEAFDSAVERATEADDEVTVAVFGDPEDRERLTARARDRLEGVDVPAELRELESDPASRLVELAEQEGFDRIVLSGGERSPLGKIQLSRVAEFVLLNATTTVTLIR